ncbi:hypothetical protein FQZ97_1081780 [compost metagenome]
MGVGALLEEPQRPGQHQGSLAFLPGQEPVPAAQRQPVGGADRGNSHDLDGEVQVRHHAPHQRQLLGVLLAEVGAVGGQARTGAAYEGASARQAGPGNAVVQQLGHHGEGTIEMAGAGRAFPLIGQAAGSDPDQGLAARVDLVH